MYTYIERRKDHACHKHVLTLRYESCTPSWLTPEAFAMPCSTSGMTFVITSLAGTAMLIVTTTISTPSGKFGRLLGEAVLLAEAERLVETEGDEDGTVLAAGMGVPTLALGDAEDEDDTDADAGADADRAATDAAGITDAEADADEDNDAKGEGTATDTEGEGDRAAFEGTGDAATEALPVVARSWLLDAVADTPWLRD